MVTHLIAVAPYPIAANRRIRREGARVEYADVVGTKIEVLTVGRVKALHTLIVRRVAIARAAGAGAGCWASRTVSVGGARLPFRPAHALLADRVRFVGASVVYLRALLSAVAKLSVVAWRVNLALHTSAELIAANIEAALPARTAIRIGRTARPGRGPKEAMFGGARQVRGIQAVSVGVAGFLAVAIQTVVTFGGAEAFHARARSGVAAQLRGRRTLAVIQAFDARRGWSLVAIRRGCLAVERVYARVRNLVANILGARRVVIATVRCVAGTCVCDTKIDSAEQPVATKRIVARAIKTSWRTLGAGDAVQGDETNGRNDKTGRPLPKFK